jgi:hypothetical protein
VRIGRAIVVAIDGPVEDPAVIAKTEIQVAFTFEEGAVYHAIEKLPAVTARKRIRSAEARATRRAKKALAAFVDSLGTAVVATKLAAPAQKSLPPLESIVKSHPLVHAAEIDLYRRVFTEACAALTARPACADAGSLVASIARALCCKPAKVASQIAAMGRASGRPWTVHQKEAALAAWLALVSA